MQIPVMACPRRSSSIPLCKSGEGCGAKHTVNPPGYIRRLAVPCPARSRRFRPGWQGQCGSSHAPLCIPYAAEGPSARKIWRPRAPWRAEYPLVLSHQSHVLHDARREHRDRCPSPNVEVTWKLRILAIDIIPQRQVRQTGQRFRHVEQLGLGVEDGGEARDEPPPRPGSLCRFCTGEPCLPTDGPSARAPGGFACSRWHRPVCQKAVG